MAPEKSLRTRHKKAKSFNIQKAKKKPDNCDLKNNSTYFTIVDT